MTATKYHFSVIYIAEASNQHIFPTKSSSLIPNRHSPYYFCFWSWPRVCSWSLLEARSGFLFWAEPTVDGRNPAPPDMYETLQIIGYLILTSIYHSNWCSIFSMNSIILHHWISLKQVALPLQHEYAVASLWRLHLLFLQDVQWKQVPNQNEDINGSLFSLVTLVWMGS